MKFQSTAFVAFLDNAISGMPSTCYPGANDQNVSDVFQSLVSATESLINWVPDDASMLLNSVRCIQVMRY